MTIPSNTYSSRDMIRLLEERPPRSKFLYNLLVGEVTTHTTPYINLDKISGGSAIARYVSRRGDPNELGFGGYGSIGHVAPYVYEQHTITPDMLDDRQPGQTEWEVDPSANETYLTARGMADLNERLDILEEKQVAESIQTGELAISGKDVNYTIDYNMDTNHIITLSGGAEWDETATNDILTNLVTWTNLVTTKGRPKPNLLIGESNAIKLFLADSTITSLLDNRRINIGERSFRWSEEDQVVYNGTLQYRNVDLDILQYDGVYDYVNTTTGAKTTVKMMDTNRVILVNPNLDYRFHYAKIENFEANGFRGQRFPMQGGDDHGKKRWMTMESSPLAGFHDVNAVVSVIVA